MGEFVRIVTEGVGICDYVCHSILKYATRLLKINKKPFVSVFCTVLRYQRHMGYLHHTSFKGLVLRRLDVNPKKILGW